MARRNAVRAGVFDQRNRATTRRRDRAARSHGAEWSRILADLEAAAAKFLEPFDDEADALERLDWRRFLSAVDGIDATEGEKLRRLAIAMEASLMWKPGPRGWLILDRIYSAALMLQPDDGYVLGSAALSALKCSEAQEPAVARRLLSVALDRARRATALEPKEPVHHHVLGRVAREDDRLEEALAHFEAACEVGQSYVWSQLYRAYTLHDLERYADAAAACEAVEVGRLTGNRAWHIEELRDTHAQCLYMIGRVDEAVGMWLKAIGLIGRRRPGLELPPEFLVSAARGPLRERLFAPLLATAQAVGDDELLEALLAADEHE